MQSIKIVLIVCFLLVIVGFFRNRRRVELRAGTRILALALFALAVASVMDPDITMIAARALGVGRGTDLILYALVVVFTLTTLGLYFRLREADQRVLDLARMIAITEAVQADGLPDGQALGRRSTRGISSATVGASDAGVAASEAEVPAPPDEVAADRQADHPHAPPGGDE